MEIRYTADRADVWRAYGRTWHHSRLNAMRAVIFFSAFVLAHAHLSESAGGPAWRLGMALLIAPLPIVALALLPVLLVKSDERVLTISPSGVATTIGKRSADVPWTKIGRIDSDERCTYIVGRSGNSFTIPHRAFPDGATRTEFVDRATRWWNEGKAR